MKIKALCDFKLMLNGDKTIFCKGNICEIPEAVAKNFIARGYAEAVKPKAKAKPKKEAQVD